MNKIQGTVIALAILITGTLALYANGNILVFGGEYPQACIGWPDDEVYSWWCTPDYTAQRPNTDINNDGRTDVLDVQLVVNAYLNE